MLPIVDHYKDGNAKQRLSGCDVAYIDTEDPFPVPKIPDNKIPIP